MAEKSEGQNCKCCRHQTIRSHLFISCFSGQRKDISSIIKESIHGLNSKTSWPAKTGNTLLRLNFVYSICILVEQFVYLIAYALYIWLQKYASERRSAHIMLCVRLAFILPPLEWHQISLLSAVDRRLSKLRVSLSITDNEENTSSWTAINSSTTLLATVL